MIEDWIVLNMTPAQVADGLEEIADEMIDDIDGGEECRGRDSQLSHRADLLRRAAQLIRAKELDKLDARIQALKQRLAPASQEPGNF